MQTRNLSFSEAIRESIYQSMKSNKNTCIIGEGVPDPKSIFGTTKNLSQTFPNRVFDMPLSENAVTGICIGLAINGFKPILVHQRLDFSFLSLDQIINNAAKWHFMFNKEYKVPIVIRMIIGRGWGQGPQHAQNFQALFSMIPGLKVIMPSTPYSVKGLLNSAIKDNNPIIFIEHRWLYSITEHVPTRYYNLPLEKSIILKKGFSLSLVAISFMVIESLKAIKIIEKYLKISIELIDLSCLNPIDFRTIKSSIKKTRNLLIVDTANEISSIGSFILSKLTQDDCKIFKNSPKVMTTPNYPVPTSHFISKNYYISVFDIIKTIVEILKIKIDKNVFLQMKRESKKIEPHDVPYKNFSGPF